MRSKFLTSTRHKHIKDSQTESKKWRTVSNLLFIPDGLTNNLDKCPLWIFFIV